MVARFGGGGHHKVYDWREDQNANPDFIVDPRMIGVKPSAEYSYPYKTDQPARFYFSHPDNYDPKNLYTNYVRTNNFGSIGDSNTMDV